MKAKGLKPSVSHLLGFYLFTSHVRSYDGKSNIFCLFVCPPGSGYPLVLSPVPSKGLSQALLWGGGGGTPSPVNGPVLGPVQGGTIQSPVPGPVGERGTRSPVNGPVNGSVLGPVQGAPCIGQRGNPQTGQGVHRLVQSGVYPPGQATPWAVAFLRSRRRIVLFALAFRMWLTAPNTTGKLTNYFIFQQHENFCVPNILRTSILFTKPFPLLHKTFPIKL